jgi:hypothetical protein
MLITKTPLPKNSALKKAHFPPPDLHPKISLLYPTTPKIPLTIHNVPKKIKYFSTSS